MVSIASGVEFLAVSDLDLARLGLFGDGDTDGEDAVVEVGLEVLEIESVAELDLAPEAAAVALTRSTAGRSPGVASSARPRR